MILKTMPNTLKLEDYPDTPPAVWDKTDDIAGRYFTTYDPYFDFERLQDVVSGDLVGIGAGKTFAACHHVAGNLFVGTEETVVAVVPCLRDISFMSHFLENVLDYLYGVRIKRLNDRVYEAGNKKILFVTSQQVNEGERLLGMNYNLVSFVDH